MADGEIATGRSPEKQDKEGKEMEEEDPGEDLYEVERVIGKSKIKVSFFSSFVCLFSSQKNFTFSCRSGSMRCSMIDV